MEHNFTLRSLERYVCTNCNLEKIVWYDEPIYYILNSLDSINYLSCDQVIIINVML